MQPYVHMTQWLGCHQQLIVHITEADSLLLLSMLYSYFTFMPKSALKL